MELTSKTRLSVVLSSYPFLKDFLIQLNPHFKSLDNPAMKNTVGKIATLSQVAMVGGMDLKDLMEKLSKEILNQTGEAVSVKTSEAETGDKQSILKGIIKDLHRGIDMNILKKRFLDLVKDVSPYEIAQMEQQLIQEGMPEQEVKKLCSVHVEVFKESLDKKTMPGLSSGHPVHTLMMENRFTEGIIQKIEELKDPEKLPGLIENISQIDRHYLRKENQLFPILEAKGIAGPSKVMWALHDDIRGMLKDVRTKVSSGTVKELEIKTLLKMITDMIYKEEHILYPMALETLSDEEWMKVKKGEEEIGFAWLEKVETWQPSGVSAYEPPPSDSMVSLNLATGQLTPEQVNLLLTHLPVDISFVNEEDEVIYYSQTKDRIFPRSPGIIGRRVQNCHPPRSVDMVEKILDSFKAGSKDSAEFWIQMKGQFIHIRYFAVRDAAGKYRGTLEVSQDLTEIRALEGQKRLLDWD